VEDSITTDDDIRNKEEDIKIIHLKQKFPLGIGHESIRT
jgi:hypothetical protein